MFYILSIYSLFLLWSDFSCPLLNFQLDWLSFSKLMCRIFWYFTDIEFLSVFCCKYFIHFLLVITVVSLLEACFVIHVFVYLFLKQKVVQGVNLHQIRGLGFDATCSLVVLDKQFRPLPVNPEGRTVSVSFCGSGRLAGTQGEHDPRCLLSPWVRFTSGAWRPEIMSPEVKSLDSS